MERELQEVMRDAAALRRDFARVSLTNSQRAALEGSSVFRETELGYLIEDAEAEGLNMALLAQVDVTAGCRSRVHNISAQTSPSLKGSTNA